MKSIPVTRSAGGLVLNNDNQILMVEEFGYFWGLPRGHVERGEDKIDAAKREIREESGITDLELCFKLGSYTRSTFDKTGKPNNKEMKHLTFYCFRTRETSTHPQDPDITNTGWFGLETARKMLINAEDIVFFETCIDKIRKRWQSVL